MPRRDAEAWKNKGMTRSDHRLESRVGREARGREEELKFWPPIVGSLSNLKIKKDEVDQAEKRI
mgnify:FL=1